MHSQNLDRKSLAEPDEPQLLPAQAANGAPCDGTIEESHLDDLLEYQPVPPRRVVTISVRYQHLGRGRPLPYRVEDGEE